MQRANNSEKSCDQEDSPNDCTSTESRLETVSKDECEHDEEEQEELFLTVRIVSARYAPCEGGSMSLLTGELTVDPHHNPIPNTRDVTPFVRALLVAQTWREETTAVTTGHDDTPHSRFEDYRTFQSSGAH